MFDSGNSEEKWKRQGYDLSLLQVLEQLEKEIRLLSNEKENLVEIEEKLWFMINEEIETKRRKNEELRMEVEEQKTRCVELTRFLNASIREDYSMAFG